MSVTVRGELDIGAQWLQPELRDILGRSATGVDLDLSAVRFCDCGGLNVLLDLRHHALDQGKTVAVRACSPVVRRLLDLTGTGELFTHSGPDGLDAPPPRSSTAGAGRGASTTNCVPRSPSCAGPCGPVRP